ncbi:hypothetical protein [Microcystis phage Mel-JY33]
MHYRVRVKAPRDTYVSDMSHSQLCELLGDRRPPVEFWKGEASFCTATEEDGLLNLKLIVN